MYYAEYYIEDRLYRTPHFDTLEDIQEYVSDIPNASIYLDEF